MGHVVLLGDSIFDNAAYVAGGSPLIEQLQRRLPETWNASLLARDGAIVSNVLRQISSLPQTATHLVISAGGNDALESAYLLRETNRTAQQGFADIAAVQRRFADDYRRIIREALATERPAVVCTVYDSVPDLGATEIALLSIFNDVIQREAFRVGLPLIDLRLLCSEPSDYSTLSAIEPSEIGGAKIASGIARVVSTHDFRSTQTLVYGR